jgi:hypothetical protein
MTATPTLGFAHPPYHVESFKGDPQTGGWHCVCNKEGFNCLHFPDKLGAKFTTLENAREICNRWNRAENIS